VVNWDQKAEAGKEEPEHPAPSFTTTAADDAAPSPSASPQTAAPAAQTTDATAAWGLGLGALGAVLGATALGLVLAGRRRAAK
jgi:cell division septation protein DedD